MAYNMKSKSINNDYAKKMRDAREAKKAELEKNRSEDIELLLMVANALEDRLYDINELREEMSSKGRKPTKEECRVSMSDVSEWFEKEGYTYDKRNRISFLVNILSELAKCQANTKLYSYNIAIRIMYFFERYQAYFSTDQKYMDIKQQMIDSNPSLFNNWGIDLVQFAAGDEDNVSIIDTIKLQTPSHDFIDDEDDEESETQEETETDDSEIIDTIDKVTEEVETPSDEEEADKSDVEELFNN